MSQKYLVSSVYCPDEYIYPQPEFAVVPVDREYIQSIIAKHSLVNGIPGIFSSEFRDERAVFVRFPDEDLLPADLFERFEKAQDDSSYFVTDFDLNFEFLHGQDIVIEHEVATIRFFGSTTIPEVYYGGYIKNSTIEFETHPVDLTDVLTQL